MWINVKFANWWRRYIWQYGVDYVYTIGVGQFSSTLENDYNHIRIFIRICIYADAVCVCVCVWWSETLINVWWWSKWNSFASSAANIYLFESNSNKQQKKNKRTNKQHQQKFAVTVLYFHFWSNFTPNVANFMSEMNLYLLISQCTLKRNFELSGCQTICG